jgi:hypothetical protein
LNLPLILIVIPSEERNLSGPLSFELVFESAFEFSFVCEGRHPEIRGICFFFAFEFALALTPSSSRRCHHRAHGVRGRQGAGVVFADRVRSAAALRRLKDVAALQHLRPLVATKDLRRRTPTPGICL